MVVPFSCFSKLKKAVIGWARYYIYFSKAALFVSGLVLSHGFVQNGVVSVLILFLQEKWKQNNLLNAAIVVNGQEGLTIIMSIVMAHNSDAYFGRFNVIVYTTAFYVTGLVLLGLSTCPMTPFMGVQMFYLGVVLVAVGKAGKDPPLKAFLADQLKGKEKLDIYHERIQARTRFWWRLASFLGATISTISLFTVWKANWQVIFASAGVMGVGCFLFLCGKFICLYNYEKPEGRRALTVVIYRVVKTAILNRHENYPSTAIGYFENHNNELRLLPEIPILRWLDKAAIIQESSISQIQQAVAKGKLCTVEQAKQVKQLIILAPLWLTFLAYCLVEAAGSTFFVEQSRNMDDTIGNNIAVPINSFFLFRSFTSFISSNLFDRLVPLSWSEARKRCVRRARMGVGIGFSIICCIAAWWVEYNRLTLVHHKGVVDDSTGRIPMSILWLVPQFSLLGLVTGLVEEGLQEFFYDHVPKSMQIFESQFNDCVLGIGKFFSLLSVLACKSWFGDTINRSHLDWYFLMLAFLSFVNLCTFGLLSYILAGKLLVPDEQGDHEDDIELGTMRSDRFAKSAYSRSFPDKYLHLRRNPVLQEAPVLRRSETINYEYIFRE